MSEDVKMCDACERRATQFFAFVFFFLGLCVGVAVPLLALHMSESTVVSRDFAERCVAPKIGGTP